MKAFKANSFFHLLQTMRENDHFEGQELLANMSEDQFDNIDIINYSNMTMVENNNSGELLSTESKIKNGFFEYASKVNWVVFAAICVFTLGSWLDICAIWSELVFLVDELPEGWRLPSILNLISVFAQLGPLSFSVGRYFFPKQFTFVRAIYSVFLVGLLSCLFLAMFWNKTEVVMHERRSIYLYIFNFTLSLLDGISTITFLPYIGAHFSKEYIIPNYIGESLSSLVPGLFAIFQSIGVNDECPPIYLNSSTTTNTTTSFSSASLSNSSHIKKAPLLKFSKLTPNYSVSIYFMIMLCLLFCSTSAFAFLHSSKTAKKARKAMKVRVDDMNVSQVDLICEERKEEYTSDEIVPRSVSMKLLLTLTFLASFIQYGYLPGLLSYSTIPYGNVYFHLSINLSSVCLPIAIFLSIWSYQVKIKRILIEFSIAASFAIYIILISFRSPCPPFSASFLGGYLVVLSWIMSSCMFLRIRCLIATKLEAYGENALFIFGLTTIFGQVLGGTLSFLSVDVYHLFKDKPKCSPDFSCF